MILPGIPPCDPMRNITQIGCTVLKMAAIIFIAILLLIFLLLLQCFNNISTDVYIFKKIPVINYKC